MRRRNSSYSPGVRVTPEIEAEVDPQLEEEAVQKTELHEQCEVDEHVIDNTGLKDDPIDFNRYNKVASLPRWPPRILRESPRGLEGASIIEVSGEASEC